MTTTIRVVYEQEPPFPATDQHPRAKRVQLRGKWVDYLPDEDVQAPRAPEVPPTEADLDEFEARARGER